MSPLGATYFLANRGRKIPFNLDNMVQFADIIKAGRNITTRDLWAFKKLDARI